MLTINKQRWIFVIFGFVIATNALAKDVSGMFLGSFILSGGLVGLFVGLASPLINRVKFLRGGALAVSVSLIPWATLLFYWEFPFPDKTLIGNLPFMLIVLFGTVPAYLMVYWLVWMVVSRQPHA